MNFQVLPISGECCALQVRLLAGLIHSRPASATVMLALSAVWVPARTSTLAFAAKRVTSFFLSNVFSRRFPPSTLVDVVDDPGLLLLALRGRPGALAD